MRSPCCDTADVADGRDTADADGYASDLAEDLEVDSGAGAVIVIASASALSGVAVGFILAGAFDVAAIALPTALVAGYLGWRARGLETGWR